MSSDPWLPDGWLPDGLETPPEPRVGACYAHGARALLTHLPVLLLLGLVSAALWFAGAALSETGVLWPLGIAFGAFITTPFTWGYYSLCLHGAQGRAVDVEDMLRVQDCYREVVIAGVLTKLIIAAGFVLLVIPGIWLYCRLAFVPYLVIEERMDALPALEESFRLTRGLAGTLFGIVLAGLGATAVGAMMFGIGIAPAWTWWDLAQASLYHAKVLPADEPDPRDALSRAHPVRG